MTGFQLFCVNRDGFHMGQKMLTLSGHMITLPYTPLGELMISPIHYIHYRICQSLDYVYGLITNYLFAWISLDCFVVDFKNKNKIYSDIQM